MTTTLQVSTDRPGTYPSVREALLDAPPGATLVVDAGSWAECLDVVDREVTVQAADGAVVEIVGDGGYDPTVRVRGGRVTLRGLVLRATEAAAVDVADADLVLTDCTLSATYGAGLRAADRARLTVADCTVEAAQQGLVLEDCSGTLERTTVRGSADDAVVLRLGAEPVLRDCTVEGAGHRGVYVYQSALPTL